MFNLEYIRHIRNVYAVKVPLYYYVKTKGSLATQGNNMKKTIQMKRTVFKHYNDFYKEVFGEEEYEKKRIQVYRFLIEAAGDGVVAPTILPGNYKLGDERTSVSEAVQEGEGFFFDIYRERKLQERLFDVIALRNELLTVDVKLLYYLSQPHEKCTFKEMTGILNISRRELSQAIQRLLAKEMIVDADKEKAKSKSKTKNKEKQQETKKKTKAWEYTLTPEADPVLAEVLFVLNDFDEMQYDGFTQEEIELYEKLNAKRNENIRRALK